MAETVAAVVVTFNRKQLLVECLAGLKAQTRPLDRIFVIDNASTDGTSDMLRQFGYLDDCLIEYVRLDQNTGGAGGFHEGIKRAYESGYEWIWLMDDDVEPYPEGLQNLLLFSSESHCIHGTRTEPDGTITRWGTLFDSASVDVTPIRYPVFEHGEKLQQVNTGCFEGMLVARDVIQRIGFPDKSFFITWDDTYYGFLASKFTKVIYANALSLQRKRAIDYVFTKTFGKRVSLSPLAAYHYQRNRFLIARQLGGPGLKFWQATSRIALLTVMKDLFLTRDLSRVRATITGLIAGMRLLGDK